MGKKIRITESQLKTIIKSKQVLKEFYVSLRENAYNN
jgi:hypothetical protein